MRLSKRSYNNGLQLWLKKNRSLEAHASKARHVLKKVASKIDHKDFKNINFTFVVNILSGRIQEVTVYYYLEFVETS